MPKKGILNRTLWVLAVCGVTVLTLAALVFLLVTSNAGEALVRNQLQTRLTRLLGWQVHISRLETNLISRVVVKDAKIFRFSKGDTLCFLHLPQARAHYSLPALLQGKLRLHSVLIQSPMIRMERDSTGRFTLPMFYRDTIARSDSSNIQIMLSRFELKDAILAFSDTTIKVAHAAAVGLNASVKADAQNPACLNFSVWIDSLSGQYDGTSTGNGSFMMRGSVFHSRVQVDTSMLCFPGVTLSARGYIDFDKKKPSSHLQAQAQGDLPRMLLPARARIADRLFPTSGQWNASITFKGPPLNPQITLNSQLDNLSTPSIGFEHIQLGAIWKDSILAINNLHAVSLLNGTVMCKGKFCIPSAKHRFELLVECKKVRLQNALSLVLDSAHYYSGIAHCKVHIQGDFTKFETWTGYTELLVKNAVFKGRLLPELSSFTQLGPSQINLALTQGKSKMQAMLDRTNDGVSGSFSVDLQEIEPLSLLIGLPQLRGQAKVSGNISGPFSNLSATAQIIGQRVAFMDFPADTVAGQIFVDNGRVCLSNVFLFGRMNKIDSLNVPFGATGWGGGFEYVARFSGPLDSLQGKLRAHLMQPAYKHIRFGAGRLCASMEKNKLFVDTLQVQNDSLLVLLHGSFPLVPTKGSARALFQKRQKASEQNSTETGSLAVQYDLSNSDQIVIYSQAKSIPAGPVSDLFMPGIYLDGRLGFELEVAGSLRQPQIDARLTAQNAQVGTMFFDSLFIESGFLHSKLSLTKASLWRLGQRAYGSGQLSLTKNENGGYTVSTQCASNGQIQAKNLDLSLLSTALPEGQIQGSASIDLAWNGTLGNPELRGSLILRKVGLRNAPAIPDLNLYAAEIHFTDTSTTVSDFRGYVQDIPFELRGGVQIIEHREFRPQLKLTVGEYGDIFCTGKVAKDTMALQLRVDDIALSALQRVRPAWSGFSGNAHALLNLYGTWSNPSVDGHIEGRRVTMALPFADEPIENGFAVIKFNTQELLLDTLQLRLGKGSIYAGGRITHANKAIQTLDITFGMQNVHLKHPKQYSIAVDSCSILYQGGNARFSAKGDIVLGDCKWTKPIKAQDIVAFFRKSKKPAEKMPAFLENTRLDIRIRQKGDVRIDNNLAHIKARGNMVLIGTPDKPNLTGRIQREKGYVLFLDRRFTILRAVVDFVDPVRLNPVVDLAAEATVAGYHGVRITPYRINLALSGPADEVKVELTSTPLLDKANIVSLLAIGTTREQLAQGMQGDKSGFAGAARDRAEAYSALKISDFVSRKLGTRVGLEQITVEGNIFDFGEDWDPTLSATKKLGKRLEITYSTNVGHFNKNAVQAGYKLTDIFSLEGETNQQGEAGIDLGAGVEFK